MILEFAALPLAFFARGSKHPVALYLAVRAAGNGIGS